ncbi:MAG: FAD:protein FMN transferase [Bacteroidales bacterium]|nr:FAD:protein FMN transferase [Candidatus Colimorpha onthohippi]
MIAQLVLGVRQHAAERLFVSMCLLMLIGGCDRVPRPIRLQGQAQGTYYSIIYYDNKQRNMQPVVDSLLRQFDLTASLWVDSSLICRVNNSSDSCVVTPLFADMLQKSLQINQYTDGAFDCRVGALVRAFGFARSNRQELSKSQHDSLLMLCKGSVWLDTLSDGVIVFHKQYPATLIDFNAIAQGYSVDMVCDCFNQLGVESYLVDIGGEVRMRGLKADGTPWKVGVEHPSSSKYDGREVEVSVPITDASLVTSGSYRKYYEVDGIRYSHTINPADGYPVRHATLSATVVDSMAWKADALATAFMVMGCDSAKSWLDSHPEVEEAFFIYDSPHGLQHYATPMFLNRLNKR